LASPTKRRTMVGRLKTPFWGQIPGSIRGPGHFSLKWLYLLGF
jgi:hypothetical protein